MRYKKILIPVVIAGPAVVKKPLRLGASLGMPVKAASAAQHWSPDDNALGRLASSPFTLSKYLLIGVARSMLRRVSLKLALFQFTQLVCGSSTILVAVE